MSISYPNQIQTAHNTSISTNTSASENAVTIKESEKEKRSIVHSPKSKFSHKKFDSSSRPSSKLVALIRQICSRTYPPNNAPIFIFENTRQAAEHNSKIFSRYHWNLEDAIHARKNTILHPGTEFRPIKDLEPLLKHHIDFDNFVKLCTHGAKYGFKDDLDYSEETRQSDLRGAIKKGNNKSASNPEDLPILDKNYNKEISKGWMIPFTKECLTKIKGAGAIPIGLASQWTLDAEGKKIPKKRTAHDLSRPMNSGHSVNNMVDENKLDDCLFGYCLLRMLHRIHHMRLRYPRTAIFMSKIDLDAAFRRLHVWIRHALLQFTVIRNIAYFLGRMPFGSNEGPGKHDIPSNMTVDLAQALIDDESWDPSDLASPNAEGIPPSERLPMDLPFGTAEPLAMLDMPFKYCTTDGYVDDLTTVVLDILGWAERARNAIALAIHTIFRPVNAEDPISRDDVISVRKLLAEGKLEEIKVVLGWIIDTRRFLIKLTDDKADRWLIDIRELKNKIKENVPITTTEWESLIGKCNTVAYIVKAGKFFLSRFRYRLRLSRRQGCHNKAKGYERESRDLDLWITIIEHLRQKGRSINHTTVTLPRILTKQDASTEAMGGFTCFGLAWRFIIPRALIKFFHINILEFLAMVVTGWSAIKALKLVDMNGWKILSQTDNTSALGWMSGITRFDPDNLVSTLMREIIGRKWAELLLDAGLSDYSQHVVGETNVIADHCSRHTYMSNPEQLYHIRQKFESAMPPNFRFVELDSEIFSWILSTMEQGILATELPKGRQTKLIEALRNGASSQPKQDSTFFSETQNFQRDRSLVASRTSSDITTLAHRLDFNLEDAQFEPKSLMFQRPSGRMDTSTL